MFLRISDTKWKERSISTVGGQMLTQARSHRNCSALTITLTRLMARFREALASQKPRSRHRNVKDGAGTRQYNGNKPLRGCPRCM